MLPLYPAAQVQLNPSVWLVQVAPCWHAPESHSKKRSKHQGHGKAKATNLRIIAPCVDNIATVLSRREGGTFISETSQFLELGILILKLTIRYTRTHLNFLYNSCKMGIHVDVADYTVHT